ncbi:similar to Saccharomyces cerevisiae YFR042W KEG1 Integral membrane protein of the ER [Maudiozyma barnettii]|uniref:Similar to Saccharomyces cerevisiae YFR042W KEG1 Integral membrane protein of the ER n=1 Tax=Maudiozyma barnettii TaxID=61262 RepID=A0A8H2ZLK6_9SACH|nr:Keg1p [Kazachstania barnettii]CAB4256222.1 similar to Saccharomyces cerevisiae YFR042W KEG1 Integral membrane protein of the ER [Kazachstania barnettii]CAD1784831.1 similar to Saccharomyces cerevisiae YFR042W KEG1 Integral membrane protein of the ER [Kazachstania barnettii]
MAWKLTHKLYQYYQLSTSFLYVALLARWIILFPLVGVKFLPGGIHEFLIYLLFFSSIIEIIWLLKFRGLTGACRKRTIYKDLNFLYMVLIIHHHDDYEHALVLKNISYSTFIVGVALSEAYCHGTQIFKKAPNYKRKTLLMKLNMFIALPMLYCSEFVLLLLNQKFPNFHTTAYLDQFNKFIMIIYFPFALTCYRKYIARS